MTYSASPFNLRLLSLIALALLCAVDIIGSGLALLLGIIWAVINSYNVAASKPLPLASWGSFLLKTAIVLLGFSLPFSELTHQASTFLLPTIILIISTIGLALMLGHWWKIDNLSAWLIGSGTAICGGSAIAAVGSSIRAPHQLMVSSLAIVFLLNACALWIFPWIGHFLEMSQQQFGVWAALAIHDTSSVVGAASQFGNQALDVATTNKLARALWIIPVALVASVSVKSGKTRISIPLFILFFLFTSSLGSVLDSVLPMETISYYIKIASKQLFAVSLLLLGASLNLQSLKQLDIKSLMLAVLLWVIVACVSLYWVMNFIA